MELFILGVVDDLEQFHDVRVIQVLLDVDFTLQIQLTPRIFVQLILFLLFYGELAKAQVLLSEDDLGVGTLANVIEVRVLVPSRSALVVEPFDALVGLLEHARVHKLRIGVHLKHVRLHYFTIKFEKFFQFSN